MRPLVFLGGLAVCDAFSALESGRVRSGRAVTSMSDNPWQPRNPNRPSKQDPKYNQKKKRKTVPPWRLEDPDKDPLSKRRGVNVNKVRLMKARQDPEIALKYYPKSVPLSPDSDGNYELLLDSAWPKFDEFMIGLEEEYPVNNDFSRIRVMLDNYRTERGIETLPCGSKRSKQTQFPGIEPTTAFLDHEVDFKWTARLATMVTELIPKEIADNKERYKINEAAWDRLQIAPVAEEKWSWKPPAPKVVVVPDAVVEEKASLDNDDDPMDLDSCWSPPPVETPEETRERDAAAIAAEQTVGPQEGDRASRLGIGLKKKSMFEDEDDIEIPEEPRKPSVRLPMTASGMPVEEMLYDEENPEPIEEAYLPPPAYGQLTLRSLLPYSWCKVFKGLDTDVQLLNAIWNPVRNVIIGKLPPGCSTEPRCDLQNHVLTVQVPVSGCVGTSGIIVNGEKRVWENGVPVVFDSTYEYSFYNDGAADEADVIFYHCDFWHPKIKKIERLMLRFFWSVWAQEDYHPSFQWKALYRNKWFADIKKGKADAKANMLARKLAQRKNKKGPGPGGSASNRK